MRPEKSGSVQVIPERDAVDGTIEVVRFEIEEKPRRRYDSGGDNVGFRNSVLRGV